MMSGKPIDMRYMLERAKNGSRSTLSRLVVSLANMVLLRERELEEARAIKGISEYVPNEVDKTPARRHGNNNYLDFLDYLFEKNKASVFPAPRPLFYNIAQQIFHEIQLTCESEGADNFIKKMSLNKEYRTKS